MGLWLFYRQKSQVVCVWKDVSAQAPVDLNGSSLSLSLSFPATRHAGDLFL